jgi:hypothetical protein
LCESGLRAGLGLGGDRLSRLTAFLSLAGGPRPLPAKSDCIAYPICALLKSSICCRTLAIRSRHSMRSIRLAVSGPVYGEGLPSRANRHPVI